MTDKYLSIINLPHHVSNKYPQMPMIDRAAQFSPFAAMVGHDELIEETARLVDSKIEIDESEKEIINFKLNEIRNNLLKSPSVVITYFVQDQKKDGGSYITINGKIKRFDEINSAIVLIDGTIVPVNDIVSINQAKC